MMKRATIILCLSLATGVLHAEDGFRHIGDFIIRSRLKVVADRVTPIAIKPLRLRATTDGVHVRLATDGAAGEGAEYEIYRSDGIGRQKGVDGALEVVPGVQATATRAGVLRQLRLTRDTLTITTFPGVSDQVIITHATAAPEANETAAAER